ncbi:hypothetical protein LPJ53_000847 [Coemansia erecta]|uniref:PCI domain-containing protein n=1 Tax=Coemansia erecta TaxID=147472 RepID=A0A9W7Y672_9FUNG|nr:hypothetical protein LPJ53_000847 [Coemansia erecta]
MSSSVAQNILFVDGEASSQVSELARFVGAQTGDGTAEFAFADGSAAAVVQGCLGGVLASAGEEKLEAVYNQLFAVVALDGPAETAGARLALHTDAIVGDLALHCTSAAAALHVLNNLYNVLASVAGGAATGAARARVFEAIVAVAARGGQLGSLVPLVGRVAALAGEWGVGAARQTQVLMGLRQALDAAGLANEAYAVELAVLQLGADAPEAAQVAGAAIVRFANLAAVCDVDALASAVAGVQGVDAAATGLLETLVSGDYAQWTAFAAAQGPALARLGVDAERAGDKMRLLTVAALAAANLGQPVSLARVAAAIGVAEEDVEMWVIDVIRAGLMQGKMNQVARSLLPTRSTYRVFGAEQWAQLRVRLAAWHQSLGDLQPVISNAKLVAQQQAQQMAGQARVTIKE